MELDCSDRTHSEWRYTACANHATHSLLTLCLREAIVNTARSQPDMSGSTRIVGSRCHPRSLHSFLSRLALFLTLTAVTLIRPTLVRGDIHPTCPAPVSPGSTVSCSAGSFHAGHKCCYPCPPGTASSETNPFECQPCTAGRYADTQGKTVCEQCGVGRYTAETRATTCSICAAGEFASSLGSTRCTPCTATPRSFQPEVGTDTCIDTCVDPYVVTTDGTQCKPISGAATTPATPCAAGEHISADGSSCIPCPIGSYSTTTNARFCTVCPAGTITSVTGSSTCTNCTVGRYSHTSGTSTCIDCEFGTYSSSPGSSSCVTCASNVYQPSSGQSTCIACVGEAQPSACITCTAGRFFDTSPSTYGINRCTECDVGKYSTVDNASTCTFCAIGRFQSSTRNTSCADCPIGRVASNLGANECVACRSGFYAVNNPSTPISSCMPCEPGSFSTSEAETCTPCPSNTYQPSSGQLSCLACGDNTTSTLIVNSNRTACTVAPSTDIIVPQCEFGQLYDSLSNTCTNCTIGTSSNVRNPSSCVPCATGSFQDRTGQRSCQLCGIGTFAPSEGATTCTLCEVGKVGPNQGASVCNDCLPGFYMNATGASSCRPCTLGSVSTSSRSLQCDPCGPGTIQDGIGFSMCVDCPAGSYVDGSGNTRCRLCPRGRSMNATGASVCAECQPGSVAPSNGTRVCEACSSGRFQPLKGQQVCQPCPAGTIANITGATTCTACTGVTYQPATGQGSCLTCDGKVVGQDQPTICLGIGTIELNVTVGIDFHTLSSNTTARTIFERAFVNDIIRYGGSNASVSSSRFLLIALRPGSTIVQFAILTPQTVYVYDNKTNTTRASTTPQPSALGILHSIVSQLSLAPQPNPSLLRNGSVWSHLDNRTAALTFALTCKNDTTGELYTLTDGSSCRVTPILIDELILDSKDHALFYGLVIGLSICAGCIIIGILFYFFFRRRGVRVRQKQIPQWGVAPEATESAIGDFLPDAELEGAEAEEEEEGVDGVKRHPIKWGY